MLKTRKEIETWLYQNGVRNFTIDRTLIVNVSGDVYLREQGLENIPVQFGRVDGSFHCSHNNLTSLQGAPNSVNGRFDCSYNSLTVLNGAPDLVCGYFDCSNNRLTNLENSPKYVRGDYYCFNNPLQELGRIDTVLGFAGEAIFSPTVEFASVAHIDNTGDYIVSAENFNAKVQELKRIREEKALFESSVAKVLDTPPLGAPTQQAVEPQPQERIKPKLKI